MIEGWTGGMLEIVDVVGLWKWVALTQVSLVVL